jgi:hypothetical protein
MSLGREGKRRAVWRAAGVPPVLEHGQDGHGTTAAVADRRYNGLDRAF